MKASSQKIMILIVGGILGILIIFIPALLTGSLFMVDTFMGGLDIADYIMRIVSPTVGILVIYDAIKTYLK
ncbi:MAG: hypothetical protein ACQGTM_02550 [bacterium]